MKSKPRRKTVNLIFAEFEDNVDIMGILKEGVKLHDVLVIQRLVDINLCLELNKTKNKSL
jgi:hypothetical protein